MMKEIVVLVAVVLTCHCYGQDNRSSFYYMNENGETWLEDLTKEPHDLKVSSSDVKIYYYGQKSVSTGYYFPCNDVSNIQNTAYSSDKPTVFVIHGWRNYYTSDACVKVKDAILAKLDVNVFLVDWSAIAQQDYRTGVAAVIPVAQYVSGFVNLLKDNHGLELSNVKIVGHSLGAHVAGIVGKDLNGKVSEITGLDPAGPSFQISDKSNRLDSSDAQFVEVIHTSAGGLGMNYSLGHADYWPNGGMSQPGCPTNDYGACSHGRSFLYFAESVGTDKFVSKQCESYLSFNAGICNNHASSSMGMFESNTNARGQYYLNTNSQSPFARG